MYTPIYALTFIEEKVQFWEKRPSTQKTLGTGLQSQHIEHLHYIADKG